MRMGKSISKRRVGTNEIIHEASFHFNYLLFRYLIVVVFQSNLCIVWGHSSNMRLMPSRSMSLENLDSPCWSPQTHRLFIPLVHQSMSRLFGSLVLTAA